jgi:hypothetical protein
MEKIYDQSAISDKLFNNGYQFTEAHNFFHKTFHSIKFYDFMDFELSALFKKPILNLDKFDRWLHCQFGEYEDKGLSMQNVLTENYGNIAALTIKGLLA